MKKSIFRLMGKLTVILLITAGCTKNMKEAVTTANPDSSISATGSDSLNNIAVSVKNSRGVSTSGSRSMATESASSTRVVIADNILTAPDSCTQLEIKIWGDYVYGEHNSISIDVDGDYVLIGGGAQVTNTSNTNVGVDALLTAAYPVNDGNFVTYSAQSKDHGELYYHRLWVYAIGMKLTACEYLKHFITRDQIIPYLNITSVTSSPAVSKPTAQAPIPSTPVQYLPLSGGAYINYGTGAGNLLMADGVGMGDLTVSTSLTSSGKDQETVSPATITSYCLSIQSNANIYGFGTFDIVYNNTVLQSPPLLQHASTITASVPSGYLVAGMGAWSDQGQVPGGRPLFAMYPSSGTVATASSKDHLRSDLTGGLLLTVAGIRPHQ